MRLGESWMGMFGLEVRLGGKCLAWRAARLA